MWQRQMKRVDAVVLVLWSNKKSKEIKKNAIKMKSRVRKWRESDRVKGETSYGTAFTTMVQFVLRQTHLE